MCSSSPVTTHGHRQYMVRLDGSGRVTLRNYRFLRPYRLLLCLLHTPPTCRRVGGGEERRWRPTITTGIPKRGSGSSASTEWYEPESWWITIKCWEASLTPVVILVTLLPLLCNLHLFSKMHININMKNFNLIQPLLQKRKTLHQLKGSNTLRQPSMTHTEAGWEIN